MPLTPSPPRSRLRLAAAIILVVGLVAAIAVYLLAGRAENGGAGYRIIGGQVFDTEDSSSGDRQSERLGGKALVRTAEFNRWLGSLWHGQRLAYTLAGLSILVALGCWYLAGLVEEPADD